MKFLSRLDPMTVLMLVVILGVVVTMSTQVTGQTPDSKATAQAMTTDSTDQALVRNHPDES